MSKLGDWQNIVHSEQSKPYYQELKNFLKEEYSTKEIYPIKDNIFAALHKTSLENVKVVILGQDPYHTPNIATGLSFAVPSNTMLPPSLRNIFNEISASYSGINSKKTDLAPWAKQGVLLLNTTLTVTRGIPGSHFGKGWEIFTEALIKAVVAKTSPVAFLLWGNHAKRYESIVRPFGGENHHYILKSTHPSSFSANRGPVIDRFVGCRHFQKVNDFLEKNGLSKIDWTITG